MEPQTIILAQAGLDFAAAGQAAESAATVQRDLDAVSQRVAKAKAALARSYVSTISKGSYPDGSYQASARWLADLSAFIAKAQGVASDKYEPWANRNVKRVGGRFARSISGGASPKSFNAPRTQRLKQRLGEERLPSGLTYENGQVEWEGKVPPSEETRRRGEQFLAAQLQADILEGELKRAFGRDMDYIDLKLNVQDARDPSKITPMDPARWDPAAGEAVSVGFDVDEQKLSQADDSVKQRVLQQKAMLEGAGRLGAAEFDTRAPLADTMSAIGRPGSLNNDRRSKFSDVGQKAGRLLQNFGPTAGAGQFLEAVGQAAGSNAAQALEPYVERAANRYTGTRVKPSEQVLELFDGSQGAQLEALSTASPGRVKQILTQVRASGNKSTKDVENAVDNATTAMEAPAVFHAAEKRVNRDKQRTDQLAMGLRSDMAALALGKQLPSDPMLNTLSTRAGKTLPSRGVVIGESGEVAFESVGQADDHYTPFSAAMLKAMEGGQFVRSRQRGGPSAEDLRTLLTSGARMATIVSSSGVFELELAPEARGLKRFGPQMQSMNDAYKRLLNTIATNGLAAGPDEPQYLGRLSPDVAQKVEAEALKGKTLADQQKKRQAARAKAYLAAAEKSANIDRTAIQQENLGTAAGLDDRARGGLSVQEYAQRMTDQEIQDRIRPLMLNGDGYDLALRTLQARFPHMIRTARRRSIEDFSRDLGQGNAVAAGLPKSEGEDRGYLAPGDVNTRSRQPSGPPTAGTPAPGAPAAGAPAAGEGEGGPDQTSQASATPTTREETLPEDTPAVMLTGAAAQQATNALRQAASSFRQSFSDLASTKEGWKGLLGHPADNFGNPGKFPDDFKDAVELDKGKDPGEVALLYATWLIHGGRMADLLKEMDANPDLPAAILELDPDAGETAVVNAIPQIAQGGEASVDDPQALAHDVTRQVKAVAIMHSVANKTFVEAPSDPERLAATTFNTPPLPADAAQAESIEDYVKWANSSDALDDEAGQSRVGRRLISSGADAERGMELDLLLTNNAASLDRDLDRLAKDLKKADDSTKAKTIFDQWREPEDRDLIPPEIQNKLVGDFQEEREQAVQYLKGALRLGRGTMFLQQALEVGGADPKALADLSQRLRIETEISSAGVVTPGRLGLLSMGHRKTAVTKSLTRGTAWRVLRQRVLSTV